jgi:hypothetical protein
MVAQTKPEVFYTKHQAGLTLIINGVPAVVDKTNPHFSEIEAALKVGNYEKVIALSNVKQTVVQAFANAGAESKLRIRNGMIFWSGPKGEEEVKGPLVDRIITTVRNGSTAQAVQPLIRLLTNISRNKRKDLREEMYQFFMSGKMPITQDGCFLAYKKVRKDFKDIYTGKMDNRPGTLVAMPEELVNTDRHNTCSVGLHFCSRSYLSQYSGEADNKIVIVKVNPRFVFAIPTDYNFAKGRASEYYVVGEVTGDAYKDEMFLAPFVYSDNVKAVAPQVKFVEGETVTINNLKPSLKTMAEGYGLSANGKAYVRTADTKGDLTPEKYTIVKPVDNGAAGYISAITGKPVLEEYVKSLSIQTKSVRAALVRAVARRRGKGA